MSPDMREYIRFRLNDAESALADARILLENGSCQGAINRLYYVCFYLVSALLWTEDKSYSKHTAVRSAFHERWVNTGRLPAELGHFYQTLFDARHQSDYRMVRFEPDTVRAWFDEGKLFVDTLRDLVEERLAADEKEPKE